MAKAHITFEDHGDRTVAFITEIEGMEHVDAAVTPAMMFAAATRAMFDNGMLSEAAAVSLAAIAEGELPSESVLAYFSTKKKEGPNGSNT